ncbi:putative auxin response factor [Helianthus anomalus]
MANTAQSELLNHRLWNAYAKPQAYVPLEGEHIYYFPQGHIEQLEGSMYYGLDQQLSTFCLPEKILCKVMNVELRDEPSTGEMHANITLMPDHDQGEMFVEARRHTSLSENLLGASVMLSHHQLGVLSVASHALTTQCRFSVIYKPRCCLSLFIINVNKYLEAQNHIIYVGMRFMMAFEDEDFAERRFGGTVVAVGEPEWKSIEVEWDENSTLLRPNKVSSWEIEPSKRSIWSSCLRKLKKLVCCACL